MVLFGDQWYCEYNFSVVFSILLKTDSINYDNELKISGQGIDELQEKLHKAVEPIN